MNYTDFNSSYPINYTSEDLLIGGASIGVRHASGGVGHGQPIEVVLNYENDFYPRHTIADHAAIIRTLLDEAGWLGKTSYDNLIVGQRVAYPSARHAGLPTIELVASEVIG